jgi:hypothetical protein
MGFPGIPVLEFPVGSELIETKIVEIRWKAPNSTVGQNDPVYLYQIYYRFLDSIVSSSEGWERIASLSSIAKRYNWIIPEYLFGSQIQIGLRSVSKNGTYSDYAVSGPFRISSKQIPKLSISNPVFGQTYGSQIEIKLNNPEQEQDYSKLNRYRINLYYSSTSGGISYAPIVERISGSMSSVIWDTEQLSPANDYIIYGFYSDDFGRKGPQVSVGPFAIENQGYMLIDTDGPEVAVKIGSDNGFIKDRDIGVEIFAYDDICGIHGFKLIENVRKEDGSLDLIKSSEPRFYQKNNFLNLSDEDNQYVISSLVQDLSGNRSNSEDASLVKRTNKYRKFFNKNSIKITSWYKNNDIIYVSLFDGEYSQVIRIENGKTFIVSSFLGRIVAMAGVGLKIYGSRYNRDRFLDLVSIESLGIVPIASLITPDTAISAIHDSLDGGVLMGCINGDIYKYGSQSLILIGNLGSPVSAIYPGQLGSIFILTENSEKVFIYKEQNISLVKITI